MIKIIVWLLLLVSCLPAGKASVFGNEASITEVEAVRSLGVDYVNIITNEHLKPEGLLLENQLQIDFPNTKIDKNIKTSRVKSKRIKSITVKQINSTARVTINLNKEVDYEIVNVFGRGKNIVEIYDRTDHTAQLLAAWEKAALKGKSDTFKPVKYKPDLKTKDQSLKGKVIIIDPGHGGKDPGGLSLHKIPEKILTLQTARRAAYLLRSAGATVYLTRNDDRTSSLRDIVNFANKIKADIFISIHYNAYYKQKVSGIETYYYNKNSRRLALIMHRTLVRDLKRRDRGLRQVGFYLVRNINTPAILLEPLFTTNAAEEKLARSADFQRKIAYSILKGVKTYFRSKVR